MPEIGGVGLLAALFAGAVSFLSPCVLPLVPGYLSAVTGVSRAELERAGWRAVLPRSLVFVASFTVIFVLLGLTAVELSRTLNQNEDTLNRIGGTLIVLMGILFVAAPFVDRLNKEWHIDALLERAGTGGPMVAGAAFAIAWSPCLGPTLGAILTLAASSDSTLEGGALLFVYSAGLAIPFLLTALAFSRMTIAFALVKRHYAALMALGGAILIVMGVLVFTGELTRLNGELQGWLDDLGINFFSEV